ncbi:uncharacterized protein [Bombus fervidus]|uniref:uncharacterized protein n=1 Tax=Bombus fervidus TaxID=203811 RepID=UPI003AB596D9
MSEIDYIIAPRIPRGLAPAVEGLAREILRQRPRNIYAFAAQHFAELVELRDKERTDEIVPRILKHKLVNDKLVKYSNLIEEAMVIREAKELTTSRNATKKAVASKRKGETTNKSGWSINRTVKGLKKHENTIGREDWNRGLNGKETEKSIPGYSDHRSPRFSSQLTCHRFVRSSSAGNIFAKRIKRREVKENHEQFYTFVLDDKSYKNEKKVTRQKSADQIERDRAYFKDICTGEDIDIDIVSTEARICRNLKDQWKTMIEDERKLQEKFGNTKGGDVKLNSRLGKKNERESKDNEVEEMFINVGSRSDSSESNIIFENAMKNLTNDGTISVVLPSVVTRQPPVKCTRNNAYECNGKDSTGNLTLPPISSDGSKSTKRGNNLIELPSLLNDVDVRLNEQTICCQDYEDPTNSNWNPKDLESETELKPAGTIDGATFDYDSKTIEKERKDEDLKAGNVNVDMVPWKYPRGSKSEGNGILVMTGNTMEEGIDEQQILGEVEIIRQCFNSPQEADIEETFKDSLNVTPDSIDLSHCQRADSLEHLENGKEEEEDQDQDEEKKEEEERYRPNELERKLIEIETVERSIENTLVCSQTIPKEIDDGFVVSERSNEFSILKNFESEKPDCVHERQVLSVGDERTKKNPDESQSPTSNEDNEDRDANIEIDSMEDETPIGKSLDCDLNSDNSEIFLNGNNNSDDRDTRDHSAKERGVDLSCYVLTEGSPSEIPETVTTVIIPDNIVDDDNDNDVCNIELEEGTNDEVRVPFNEPISSWNIERKQMKHGIGEEYCHDENPFGEYIHPESAVDYTTNIDAHILRGIKNAANRAPVYQEDLANIKEEEENDRGKFSNVDVQRSIDDSISVFSKKSAESMENKNSIESEEKSASSGQEEDQEGNSMDDKDDARSKDLSKETPRKRREEESETFDDRSSDFSLSFEQLGAGPKVPELNLDSLQDITISSTIEKDNSKNLNNQSEEENDNVTSCEGENVSSSSFDTLASEEKVDVGEASSSENDRVKAFIEPAGQQTKIESETERYSKEEFQGDECINNTSGSLLRNKDEKQSLRVEEEIARELIQNFIIDNTDVAEKDAETNDVIPLELDDLTASSSSKHQASNANQTDDFIIKFHPSIQELAPEAIIEKSSGREKVDDDNNQAADENEEDERRSGGSGETAREDDGGKEDQVEKASLENQGNRSKPIASLWHTGEFHDSLPLPFVEISKSLSATNVYDLKPVNREKTDDRFTPSTNLYAEDRECKRIGRNIPFFGYKFTPTTAPRGIDIFENLSLFINESNWSKLSLNASSPIIIHSKRVLEQVRTTDEDESDSLVGTSSNSDADDLREPLALDNTPQPIVIEEISDIDERGEQTLSLHEADTNLAREISPFSFEQYNDSNNVEDKNKGTHGEPSSICETTNGLIESDNLLLDACTDSTNHRDID